MSNEKDSELEDTPMESILMPKILEFYEDVITLLKSFRPILSYFEIKSKLDKLTHEVHSLDFVNFIILIGDTEYLIFLKNTEPDTLTERDLERFFSIFSTDTRKEGIIIVWNGPNLPAIKLGEADLHDDYIEVLEDIKKNLTELRPILDEEVKKIKKISETLEIPKKQFTKEISLDIIKEFENDLHGSYETRKDRYQTQRRELLNGINPETFNIIIKLFTDFFLKKIEKENLKENYKKIIEENFEK